jgi:hypothetical protein
MPSVLLHCAQQHYRIGTFGFQKVHAASTTDAHMIRTYKNHIADMVYEAASRFIAKRNALFAGDGIQVNNDENIYWEVILKGAAQLDPASLPPAKGPSDDFIVAEKVATYNFMDKAGLGTSASNQRHCRWLWKSLSDFRMRGVEMITCYRTAEFNRYCKEYPRGVEPSLVDTIVSWEAVYGPLVPLLERRAYEQLTGDFSGRLHLTMKSVAERLAVAGPAWNDGCNEWFSDEEAVAFNTTTTIQATSSQTLSSLFNDRSSTGSLREQIHLCYSSGV